MNESNLISLERLLQSFFPSQGQSFPNRQEDYFKRYCNVKDWLSNNVYPLIGAALSTDGGIYTSHGADHFDEVILYAGNLLGIDGPESVCEELKPYEIYVLLIAILLHDAGNVYGRDEHEKQAFGLLRKMQDISGCDDFEKKAIARVAGAHGGRTSDGGKDTISEVLEKFEKGQVYFRGQMLAALLRFADEICEHRGRDARILLDDDKLPSKSEVYHVYARSIASTNVDKQGRTININFVIPVSDVTKLWGKDETKVYLTDEILERLEKMDRERIYCNRFMGQLVVIQKIKVAINIVDENLDTLEVFPITLEDSGYPILKERLAERNPNLKGQTIHKHFTQGTGQ